MTSTLTYPFGLPLDAVQLRVLGALIEKEIATPEQYPLSLNAMVNACNQRSSREPVMTLAEREVEQALRTLEDHDLVYPVRDLRVAKYEHRIRTVLNLRRDETAVLCLLLLRGAQTPGELRARADRLYSFDDLTAVQATLDRLASRQPSAAAEGAARRPQEMPLTMQLPRQPGSREARFMHLLGEIAAEAAIARPGKTEDGTSERIADRALSRIEQLEAEMIALREQTGALAKRIEVLEGHGEGTRG